MLDLARLRMALERAARGREQKSLQANAPMSSHKERKARQILEGPYARSKTAAAAHNFLQGLPLRAGFRKSPTAWADDPRQLRWPSGLPPSGLARCLRPSARTSRRIELLNKHLLGEEAEVRRLKEQCFAAIWRKSCKVSHALRL